MCLKRYVSAIGKIMKCEIFWNNLSLDEWNERFNSISHSNFMQSYVYALGASRFNRQRVRWGLIKIDDQEAGLVQIFEAGFLFNAIHGVVLDRGPLWFDGYGAASHLQAFLLEFQRQFPKRLVRKRRVLLEVEDGAAAQALIKQTGLKCHEDASSYETYCLDLSKRTEDLRADLNGKWRNALVKAEKQDLTVKWDFSGEFYPWIRELYEKDKKKRQYGGISSQFLDILTPFLLDYKSMIIGKVTCGGRDVAGVLFLLHGQSATYQIGVTTKVGRDVNAHHLLLWQGLSVLQERGIKSFDLGGINDEDADGIKRFKKGMGGQPYRLVGHYS